MNYIAIHAITLQIAELGVAFTLGVSEAIAIRIGTAIGAQQQTIVSQIAYRGLLAGFLFMLTFAVILFFFGEFLVNIFADDQIDNRNLTITGAQSLLYLVAICLIIDSGRIILIGILRGAGEVIKPFIQSFFALWLVSLPTAYILSIYLDMLNTGVWLALIIGAIVANILLGYHFMFQLKKYKLEPKNK